MPQQHNQPQKEVEAQLVALALPLLPEALASTGNNAFILNLLLYLPEQTDAFVKQAEATFGINITSGTPVHCLFAPLSEAAQWVLQQMESTTPKAYL